MNYEEKYNQAIEAAKRELRCCGSLDCDAARQIFRLFPELRESEDEKIRSFLIGFIKACRWAEKENQGWPSKEECLAWLEKQGEQKPDYCHHEVDLSDCSEEYRKAYYDGWNNCNQQHAQLKAEQKAAWSEEDDIRLNQLIGFIQKYGLQYYSSIDKVIDWLKSIKPNHWKPSEQNIKDLEWCANLVKDKMGVGFHRLQVFIDELKSL